MICNKSPDPAISPLFTNYPQDEGTPLQRKIAFIISIYKKEINKFAQNYRRLTVTS